VIRFPVLFYPSLFPFQVHLSSSYDTPAPLTDTYHDLRLIACAARSMDDETALEWLRSWTPADAALHEVAAIAAIVNRRYEQNTEVKVYDRYTATPAFHRASFFTINHPSRLTMRLVAEDVHDAVGLPYADTGTDEFLGSIRTPLEAPVVNALGLPGEGTSDWTIEAQRVPMEDVARAHLDFYRQHPGIVTGAMEEHAELLVRLGLNGAGS
jgi:hypothetical protein